MSRSSIILRIILILSVFTLVDKVHAGIFNCGKTMAALEDGPILEKVILPFKVSEEVSEDQTAVKITCVTDCSQIDWSRYKGKRVQIQPSNILTHKGKEYPIDIESGVKSRQGMIFPRDHNYLDQMVLDTEVLAPEIRKIAGELRKDSMATNSEVGVWVFLTKGGKILRSRRINSQKYDELDGADTAQAFNDTMTSIQGQSHISEIIFMHTHPDSSHLSPHDLVSLSRLAALYPNITMRTTAFPNADPSLFFLKTHRR